MEELMHKSNARGLPALFVVLIVALVLLLATASLARCEDGTAGDATSHNQKGLEYFNQAFYEHTPKLQVQESGQQYSAAEDEFKKAIAADPSFVDAHRNLARLRYVQKNFPGAAEEYKKVTELAPSDLDAYINLALAYIESGKYDAAIQALETARLHTADPKALDTLNRYIEATRKHQ
jgi:tetratricopeptide (TPR) repeat protein